MIFRHNHLYIEAIFDLPPYKIVFLKRMKRPLKKKKKKNKKKIRKKSDKMFFFNFSKLPPKRCPGGPLKVHPPNAGQGTLFVQLN